MNPHRLLADCFPDLADRPVTVVQSGLDSLVLDVDDEWIVRLPRRADVQQHFSAEAALLRDLAVVVSVPVPLPELSGQGRVPAMRYRKLSGSTPDNRLQRAPRVQLAGRLGQFVGEVHDFPAARVKALGVRAYDPAGWLEQWHIFHDNARRRAFPLLDRRERRRAADLFDGYLEDDANSRFAPSLVHGDLAPKHLLCDAQGVITGVIDWTDARVGDPAVDLAWPVHGTDAAFARAFLDQYPFEDPALVKRAGTYYRLGAPWFELLFGLEENNPELITSGLAGVRERL